MRVKQDERYKNFLANKVQFNKPKGFNVEQLNPMLYDFQSDIVKWSLMQGMTAIFADCGLGKTPMQLEWAQKVCEHTGGNVLILAPLAVSQQTVREGDKFGIKVKYCRNQKDVEKGITITNYEMLDAFDGKYQGVVLDARLFEEWFAGRICEIGIKQAFFAYDRPKDDEVLYPVFKMLRERGCNRHKLYCYVLIGYRDDTIKKAAERLQWIVSQGVTPFAMYYRSADEKKETPIEWRRFIKAWSRPGAIFSKHQNSMIKGIKTLAGQKGLFE